MSGLEALRAEIAAEEEAAKSQKPTEEVTPEVDEVETAEEADPIESDEGEEVDEIDLGLDDEPQVTKPTAEQSLVFKLTKEKKKRQEANSELEQLRAEIEALKAGKQITAPVQAPRQAPSNNEYPPVPLLYENGLNTPEAYQQAYNQWSRECRNIDNRRVQQDQARVHAEKANSERAQRLAQRSVEFITANKIKPDLATNTIQAGVQGLDDVLGVEGAALDLLDNIGEGSDKLAYYLGKNPDALETARKLFQDDPRGFKVNTWLTQTAGKLNRKNTNISKAPAPDEALRGDGSSSAGALLQSQYDKESDFNKLRELRTKARELGITLK